MRNLGDLSEDFFRVWCSSLGFIANSSKIDRTGWDFFVELPWKDDISISNDMLPSPIECKIQVKGTDQQNRKVAVSLSNLNRLIRTQIPAFYCLIEFSGRHEPQAVFLKHVDPSMIEKVLKRIRELEYEEGDRKLNRHKMNIRFKDNERLEQPFAESLKKAIEGHLHDGMEKYVENKNKVLKTLGFEDGSYKFKFTMSGDEEAIRQIVDASLGLREEVDIEAFESHHTRFGILSNKPVFYGEKGRLSFGDVTPASKAIVKFKEHDYAPSLPFETRVYFSPLAHLIPAQFNKVRLEGELFQILIEPFTGKIGLSFDLRKERRTSLRELKNMLKVLMLFKKSAKEGNGLILEIEVEDSALSISPRMFVNDEIADWSGAYKIAEMAASICHDFEVSDNTVLVNFEDLSKAYESIIYFRQLIAVDPGELEINLGITDEIESKRAKVACILPFICTHIGDHTFGCLLGLVGLPTYSGNGLYRLTPDKKIIESRMIKKDGDFTDQKLIDEKMKEFAEKAANDGFTPIILLEQRTDCHLTGDGR